MLILGKMGDTSNLGEEKIGGTTSTGFPMFFSPQPGPTESNTR